MMLRFEQLKLTRVRVAAVAVLLVVCVAAPSSAAADGGTTTITGTVVAGGAPLGDVDVYASSPVDDYNDSQDATTAVDGSYALTGLAPDTTYTISFTPNESSSYAADAVTVTTGAAGSSSQQSATLDEGGTISGTVTGSDDVPICVTAYSENGLGNGAATLVNSEGTYTITGLTSGDYQVEAYQCQGDGYDQAFDYSDSPAEPQQKYEGTFYSTDGGDEAAEVSVTNGTSSAPGDDTGDINIQLVGGAQISGNVSAAGQNLAGVCVSASPDSEDGFDYVNGTVTNASGDYTLTGLVPGVAYDLYFSPCEATGDGPGDSGYYDNDGYDGYDDYGSTAYDDGYEPASPSAVVATVEGATQNVVLSPLTQAADGDNYNIGTSAISGTVTNADGDPITTGDICVSAEQADDIDEYDGLYDDVYPEYSTQTNSDGDYTLSGLESGSYYVHFADCPGSNRSDVAQWYLNTASPTLGGALQYPGSNLVTLSDGGTQTGVDAELSQGSTISGNVTGTPVGGSNQDLSGICVTATSLDSNPSNSDTVFQPEYGTVTSADGAYSLRGLYPDAAGYEIEFSDCNEDDDYGLGSQPQWVTEYYGGSFYYPETPTAVAASQTPETVTDATIPAQVVTGINGDLDYGGSITGTIENAANDPVSNGQVCAIAQREETEAGDYDDNYYGEAQNNPSSGTATYTISGLPAGEYDVSFNDCDDYYASARNDIPENLPDPVTVSLSEDTTAVNSSLANGAFIEGTVFGGSDASTPLSDAYVEADGWPSGQPANYEDDSTDSEYAYTDSLGQYVVGHLDPTLSWTIYFGEFETETSTSEYNGEYSWADQYYDDTDDLDDATQMPVAVGTPVTGINAHLVGTLVEPSPAVTITDGPAADASTDQTSATFSFDSALSGAPDSDVSYVCTLIGPNESVDEDCTSPWTTPTLTNGAYQFSVTPTDNNYETTGQTVYVDWSVDASSLYSSSEGTVAGGQEFTTDPGGTTSSSNPEIVGVTPPAGTDAEVTVSTQPTTTPAPNGYALLGQQILISAEQPGGGSSIEGTVSAPISLTLTLDGADIPSGTSWSDVTITRNGTPAPDCTVDNATASPDPCVESRTETADGGVTLVVLTTSCSTWNFADVTAGPVVQPSTPPSTPPVVVPPSLPAVTASSGPSVAAIKDALARVEEPTGAAAKIATLVKKKGYSFTFKAPSAGKLVIDWYAKIGKKKKVLIADMSESFSAARSAAAKVSLTGAGLTELKKVKKLAVTADVSFKPTVAKVATTTNKSFTLKR